MAKIEDVINGIEREIIQLTALNHINVTKRIDEVIDILEDIKSIAIGTQGDQKFDLIESATGCSIAYSVGGQSISAGANVLTYGDELTITVTPNTGYSLQTFTINGENAISGSTITVTDNLQIVAVATINTYNLTADVGTHCTATFTVGGENISAGVGALTYGDELTITCVADTGYELTTLTVNGETFVSGSIITVTDDITLVASASIQTFDLTETLSENCTVVYTIGETTITAGTDVLSYGDELTITVSANEGYTIDTFTVNGTTATSGTPITVTSNIAVVVTTTAVL